MKVCGVRFKGTGKLYFFSCEGINLSENDYVVVDTEKGNQYAKVVNPEITNLEKVDVNKLKPVLRVATKKDENDYAKNLKDAKEALDYAKNLSVEQELEMNFVEAVYTLDRKQLIFNFIADDRIDFRNFVKDLAAKYKTRIELHQMGVRDKAKECGGIGQCGRELCCSKFLSGMDTISINMAKNQGIALNPTKINGVCGRLLCCLAYEDEVYSNHRKELPKMGEILQTPNGKGKVVSLDVLNKVYTVEINGERFDFNV